MSPCSKRRTQTVPHVSGDRGRKSVAVVCSLLILGGCAGIPKFGAPGSADALAPRVSDITDKIQCEIIDALHSAKYDDDATFRPLAIYRHVVSVNLSLEVTNMQAANPSLSYIKPYATAGENFTALVGGQWTGTQDRIFNQTFTLVFDLGDETPERWDACSKKAAGSGLRGNLGIKDVIASGLRYESADSDAYKLKVLGLSPSDPQDPLGGSVTPSFGSTVDFTLVYGVNGGPNWTLTHFTGPATGLLNFNRTRKDTLQLSFARVISSGATQGAEADAERQAGKASKDNLTNEILQRLLVRP
jgi:hypothetical protein